jgi:hypothetical protein
MIGVGFFCNFVVEAGSPTPCTSPAGLIFPALYLHPGRHRFGTSIRYKEK